MFEQYPQGTKTPLLDKNNPDHNKEASLIVRWIKDNWTTASPGYKASGIYRIKALPENFRRGIWDVVVHDPVLTGPELREFSGLYKDNFVDRRV